MKGILDHNIIAIWSCERNQQNRHRRNRKIKIICYLKPKAISRGKPEFGGHHPKERILFHHSSISYFPHFIISIPPFDLSP
jgi:hypothetical protein